MDGIVREPLDERPVLEHDHLLDPVRPQLLEERGEIPLLPAEMSVRRDERDPDRFAHRFSQTAIAPSTSPRAPRHSRFTRRCPISVSTSSTNCARASKVCGKFLRNR